MALNEKMLPIGKTRTERTGDYLYTMEVKERKPEDVQNYIDIYEILRKAVPDGANVLAVLRAAEFLLADCIASADVTDEVMERAYAAIPDDIRNFVKAFSKED